MAKQSSQKFIARNRAPRVQIEYDVEVYGAEKTVQIPFVMGALADLSGKPAEPLAPVSERKFLEVDVDNFDERLKAMKPRVAFAVPNTLTGDRAEITLLGAGEQIAWTWTEGSGSDSASWIEGAAARASSCLRMNRMFLRTRMPSNPNANSTPERNNP